MQDATVSFSSKAAHMAHVPIPSCQHALYFHTVRCKMPTALSQSTATRHLYHSHGEQGDSAMQVLAIASSPVGTPWPRSQTPVEIQINNPADKTQHNIYMVSDSITGKNKFTMRACTACLGHSLCRMFARALSFCSVKRLALYKSHQWWWRWWWW